VERKHPIKILQKINIDIYLKFLKSLKVFCNCIQICLWAIFKLVV